MIFACARNVELELRVRGISRRRVARRGAAGRTGLARASLTA